MAYGRNVNVGYMLNGIAHARILGDARVRKIDDASFIHNDIFKNGSGFNGSINIRLTVQTQINHFGITPPLKVKYGIFCSPTVLVIPDKASFWVSRQGSFTSTG